MYNAKLYLMKQLNFSVESKREISNFILLLVYIINGINKIYFSNKFIIYPLLLIIIFNTILLLNIIISSKTKIFDYIKTILNTIMLYLLYTYL